MSRVPTVFDVINMEKASCTTVNPDIFFPEVMSRTAVAEAKAVCAGCQVAASCLTWALENQEMGIWGGATETERKLMKTREKFNDHLRKLTVFAK
jgi:WhiB family redox-sensing transcriptional regulator